MHADAATAADTDWRQIVALYDQLLRVRADAGRAAQPRRRRGRGGRSRGRASDSVDGLDLDDYHLFHATRADLLVRAGRADEAVAAYDAAIGLATNAAERAHLERRRAALR